MTREEYDRQQIARARSMSEPKFTQADAVALNTAAYAAAAAAKAAYAALSAASAAYAATASASWRQQADKLIALIEAC